MSSQLSDFERRQEQFSRVRALIMKLVTAEQGLTVEEISKRFMVQNGFLPRIDNRLRELRELGWVESKMENGLLRWYAKTEEPT